MKQNVMEADTWNEVSYISNMFYDVTVLRAKYLPHGKIHL